MPKLVLTRPRDDANALQRNDTVTTRPSAGGKSGLVIDAERAPEMVTPLQSLGENPTWIDCPFCRKRTMTRTSKEGSSAQTYVSYDYHGCRVHTRKSTFTNDLNAVWLVYYAACSVYVWLAFHVSLDGARTLTYFAPHAAEEWLPYHTMVRYKFTDLPSPSFQATSLRLHQPPESRNKARHRPRRVFMSGKTILTR